MQLRAVWRVADEDDRPQSKGFRHGGIFGQVGDEDLEEWA
jgi:hypothetical protein